jgi:hypothetical protein
MTGTLYFTFADTSGTVPSAEQMTTVLVGGHSTGMTEVGDNGECSQYRHSLPATYRCLPDGLLHGPRLRHVGTDKWLPLLSALVSVERSVCEQEGGWEWREDRCAGRTWQYWWVPESKLDEFIADREDRPAQ